MIGLFEIKRNSTAASRIPTILFLTGAMLLALACGGQETAESDATRGRAEAARTPVASTRAPTNAPPQTGRDASDTHGRPLPMATPVRTDRGHADSPTPAASAGPNPESDGPTTAPGRPSGPAPTPTSTPGAMANTPAAVPENLKTATWMLGQFRYKSVVHHATLAIAENPSVADAYVFRAYARIALRQFEPALEDLETAIDLGWKPLEGDALVLATARNRLVSDFGRFESMMHAQVLRAFALTRLGQHEEAVRALRRIGGGPYGRYYGTVHAIAHYNLGDYGDIGGCCERNRVLGVRSDDVGDRLRQQQPGLDVDIRLNPSDADALKKRAELHRDLGELEKALHDHELAIAAGGRAFDAFALWSIHSELRNFEQALMNIDELIEIGEPVKTGWVIQPEPAGLLLWRAMTKIRMGDLEGAERDLLGALDLSGWGPGLTHFLLGFLHLRAGVADSEFVKACRAERCLEHSYFGLGVLSDLLDLEAAQDPQLYLYRADSQCGVPLHAESRCNNYAGSAFYDYNQAVMLDPTLSEAYVGRAITYGLSAGWDDPKTSGLYAQALEFQPDNVAIYQHRMEIRADAGDNEGVVEDLTALIDLQGDAGGELHFRRGQYHGRRNKDAAEEDYLKALELGYDQNEVRDALVDLER